MYHQAVSETWMFLDHLDFQIQNASTVDLLTHSGISQYQPGNVEKITECISLQNHQIGEHLRYINREANIICVSKLVWNKIKGQSSSNNHSESKQFGYAEIKNVKQEKERLITMDLFAANLSWL